LPPSSGTITIGKTGSEADEAIGEEKGGWILDRDNCPYLYQSIVRVLRI